MAIRINEHYDGEGLSPKREEFARAFLELGNARQAYLQVYNCEKLKPATVSQRANALLREPQVAKFIENLRVLAAKRNEITIDNLTQMLIADRLLARELGTPSSAITAVMGMAKLHGLLVDKSKVTVDRTLSDMTDEELDAFILSEAKKLGLGKVDHD